MGTLSTHVLDTSRGAPAEGVAVQLLPLASSELLGEGVTNADGRVPAIGPERLEPGDYRLRFDTGGYFAATGAEAFYPEVVVAFSVAEGQHYHVPLLLNPFGYSTYRGS
jgi:5-hydroxyisourate hydrolase